MRKILLLVICTWFITSVGQAKNHWQYLEQYVAKVERIVDGDTLMVQDDHGSRHKIRLANIDAPELHQTNGKNSRDNMLYLIDKTVTIKVWYFDRYKREVSDVFFRGKDVGLGQIKDGFAWVYTDYANRYLPKRRLHLYYQAENNAKLKYKGLWANREAIPPWLFRHRSKININK